MADWCKLPYDIIHKVSTYLTTIEDFLAFSAVCHSWRSIYIAKQWHPCPEVPMLMCSDYENSSFRSFISLYRNKVYNSDIPEIRGRRCWGSSSGWLVSIGDDFKIHLLNPFTRVSICLPPISSLQICFGEILHWYDIIEKAYVFRNEEDLVVVILYGPLKQLAVCRPGYSSWRSIEDTTRVGFLDVTCLKGQIYALRWMGSLVVIDVESLSVVDINSQHHPGNVALLLPHWDWEQLFLVESSGDLWLVYRNRKGNHSRRSSINSMEFLVYTFDFGKKRWIRLSNLGNRTIFVGDHCSVVTSATDFLNCKSNSVYFAGTRTEPRWPYGEFHVDFGVYSLGNGVSEPLCFGSESPKCYSFPIWVTPSLY